jgi:hypothetical protein
LFAEKKVSAREPTGGVKGERENQLPKNAQALIFTF